MEAADKRRKREARFIEIAELAGVSQSTVNRVLNERGSVSDAARKRVIEAARALGIKRTLPRARQSLVHIDVYICQSNQQFDTRLLMALERAMKILDKRIVLHRFVVPNQEQRLVNLMREQHYKRHAVIVMVRDTAPIRSVLEQLISQGTAVVSIVSDIGCQGRSWYAGVDNLKAGETAGWFIARMAGHTPGRVLKLVADPDYVVHQQRERGFSSALGTAPRLAERSCITHERADLCYQAVKRELASGGLRAIYNTGAGSEGIYQALKESGAWGEVVWVGHELYDHHNQYLGEGVMDLVIDQDPAGQVANAIEHALHACGVTDATAPDGAAEFRLYFPVNRPAGSYLA